MKKFVFAFFFAAFSSLVAAAGNEHINAQGITNKEENEEESFTIYESGFNLFKPMYLLPPSADGCKNKNLKFLAKPDGISR